MLRRILVPVVAILLLVLPVGLLVWMRGRTEDRLSALDPVPEPVLVTVAERPLRERQAVTVIAQLTTQSQLLAPRWSGLVTAVHLVPEEPVGHGDVVVAIDGVGRVAFGGPYPFWRDLEAGDTGEDVAMLQTFLVGEGFDISSVDGTYGAETRGAVVEWARRLGIQNPTGAFSRGWVVWLPEDPFVVASHALVVGRDAPASGEGFAEAAREIVSLDVLDHDGDPLPLAGDWLLLAGDVEVLLRDGQWDPADAATLREALGTEPVEGSVVRSEGVVVVDVPSSAVRVGASGELCAYVVVNGEYEVRTLDLAGGEPGTAAVVRGVESGDVVLANPAVILGAGTNC